MKIKALIVLYWTVLVLPLIGYLVVNYYWWLFDGNTLIDDKMGASLVVLMITLPLGLLLIAEFWDEK